MANNYYGNRGNGSSLRHYRTKGSKNGYSKDPNYRPVGDRAKGQFINGRYVYSNPSPLQRPGTKSAFNDKMLMKNSAKYASEAAGKAGSYRQGSERAATKAALYGNSIAKGAANNWQQKGNATASMYRQAQAVGEGRIGAVRFNNSGLNEETKTDATNRVGHALVKRSSRQGAKNNWQQQANAYRSADEHVNMYAQKRIKDSNENFNALNAALSRHTTDGAHLRNDDSYKKASKRVNGGSNINSVHNAQTERERSERARKSSKSAINYDDPNNAYDFFRGVRADPRFNKSTVKGISGMVYSHTNKPQRAAEIADMKARREKKLREDHPVKYAIEDAKIKASQTAHKAKKETKKLINKGKNTVDSLLNKFKKKKK